jgi:hypothetical protein
MDVKVTCHASGIHDVWDLIAVVEVAPLGGCMGSYRGCHAQVCRCAPAMVGISLNLRQTFAFCLRFLFHVAFVHANCHVQVPLWDVRSEHGIQVPRAVCAVRDVAACQEDLGTGVAYNRQVAQKSHLRPLVPQ